MNIPAFSFRGQPLKKEECENLLKLSFMKDDAISFSDDPELSVTFPAQVISKRIEAYKLPYNLSCHFFIMSLMTTLRTPGDCMILLWLCHQYYKETNKKFLNIKDWCMIFPMGVPTDDEKHKWWDSQKIPYEERNNSMDDNLVDIAELWQ